MFDITEKACFLKVVRPPSKTVKHVFSGKCEIQRYSITSDHQSLQYSIRHSKMLQSYKKVYSFSHPYKPEQTEALMKAKNITQEQNKFYIAKLLREVHCYQYTIHYLQEKCNKKYDQENQDHEKKLLSIWGHLKPQQQLSNRISKQWIEIGFQVEDPATDFRGAGELGLQNLFRFSSTEKGYKLFQIASASQTWYFFCSAGLYFTMLAMEILKTIRFFEYQFWIHQNNEELINNFQIVYQTLFGEFSHYWVNKCQNKTIMYFNENLKNFKKLVGSWDMFVFKQKIMENQY